MGQKSPSETPSGRFAIEGRIVDVRAGKVFPGKIEVSDGKILRVVPGDTDSNVFIAPGFIDAHVHIESSMLPPTEFARLAVPHGTVATISDPHEIGNVLGSEGVRYMIAEGKRVPLKFYFGVPSCVPATAFETAGAEIGVDEVRELLALEEVRYLAEMMNFPGVLNQDPVVMAKIKAAHAVGKPVDGHAPGLRGEAAAAYIAAGISTDHECFTRPEAEDKLKFGMKILIREGSAAKNFDALISLLNDYPDEVMFCSDDKHPNDLVRGHLNLLAARAVAFGCDPMRVMQACSRNVVDHYGLKVGLLQEGDPADFILLKDLTGFEVLSTWIEGEKVAENGRSLLPFLAAPVVNKFDALPIRPQDLRIPADRSEVKVIEVEDGQLITTRGTANLQARDGHLASDPSQDILKMVVLNRYATAAPALAFVRNFGLKRGAIASSVAHDSHNIIAVGVSDEDLAAAINLVVGSRGGVALADGERQEVLSLPIAGLMSDAEGYEVADRYEELDHAAKALGSKLVSPFMTLSFCALLVIPHLKLSDLGLFDGDRFEFTSLYAASSADAAP